MIIFGVGRYDAVHKSTGLRATPLAPPPELAPVLLPVLEECRRLYDQLTPYAINLNLPDDDAP